MADLASTLAEIRRRLELAGKRKLNEQNTKATLIEPILRALNWDVEDFEEVQREFKIKKADKPVDYGLLLMRTPRLFIEAKALGQNLDDRRWANQIMGYASVAGVEWIVLTDGDEYRIYNTHAPVSVEEKLFRTVRITDEESPALETLELLRKDRMEENKLELLWRSQFVDRQVQQVVEQVFTPDSDMLLVNYIAGHTKNLTTEEIRESLRRCHVTLDFPVQFDLPAPTKKKRRVSRKKTQRRTKIDPDSASVSIQDLIGAGLIAAGAELIKQYKGKRLKAKVEPDGRVRFGRTLYDSPSTAGGAARATVIGLRADGRVPATNGWVFWQVVGDAEKPVSLDALRQQYIERAGGSEAAG